MSNLISRQAAIDVLSLGKEILSRVLDDIDVVGTDREKYSWGLGLIELNIEDIKELPSAQPDVPDTNVGDMISRQAAIDAIVNRTVTVSTDEQWLSGHAKCELEIIDIINSLPSAQPERKAGEWTDDNACPFCGFQPWYERDIHTLSYCPNCGADMRGEQDE